jgi:hypothetical protein
VLEPLTFLNQERWKNEPPAAPSSSKPSELRVREMSDVQRDDARFNQEIMRLRKLPGNGHKSDDELAKLAHHALYGSAA